METIINENGQCIYIRNFLKVEEADNLFTHLQAELDWKQDPIILYGQKFLIPRLHCWYGDFDYSYSKITLEKREMPQLVLDLKNKIEDFSNFKFNGVLANRYRDGRDSNGWHRDNEKELCRPIHIASISLGEERQFSLRRRGETKTFSKLNLEHGSLLLMTDPFQDFWEHQITKTAKEKKERINLTFRRG